MQPSRASQRPPLKAIVATVSVLLTTSAAADIRYVDGTNNCSGNTPCDNTIQAAVDVATAPAVIQVYPGTYNESVVLPQMSGDLTLQAVSASGSAATSPSVTINGGASPAIDGGDSPELNPGNPVNPRIEGKLTVSGFVLQNTEEDCLIAIVEGEVVLSQMTVSNCKVFGINVYLLGDGALTAQNISASNNGEDGIQVSLLPETGNESYSVTLIDVKTKDNGDDGVHIDDDIDDEERELVGAADITFTRVTSTSNGLSGFGDGIEVNVTGASVALANVTTSDNTDDGTDIGESAGRITVDNSEANGNDDDGFDFDDPTYVEIANSTAKENLGEGFEIDDDRDPPQAENLLLSNVVANSNINDGFDVGNFKVTSIRNGEAIGNGDDGLDIKNDRLLDNSASNEVAVSAFTADNNGDESGEYSNDGIEIWAETVTLSGVATNNNRQDGIDIEDADRVDIQNATARNNDEDGLEIDVLSNFQGSGITTTGNEVGFRLEAESDDEDLGNVSLRNVIVSANDYGVVIQEAQTGSIIAITDSDITGNGIWGIGIDENSSLEPDADDSDNPSSPDAVVDARRNYWGAASGPTHPTNPSGSGDVVADSENDLGAEAGGPNTGTINFDDFRRESITTALPVPALGGLGLLLLSILAAALALSRNRVA